MKGMRGSWETLKLKADCVMHSQLASKISLCLGQLVAATELPAGNLRR